MLSLPKKRQSGVIELGISFATPRAGIPAKPRFQAWAQAAFDAPTSSSQATKFAAHVGMSLRFVDLDEGRALNLQYRGRDYATNVLSFPSEVPVGMPKSFKLDWLGDLVVCSPVIVREAQAEADKSLQQVREDVRRAEEELQQLWRARRAYLLQLRNHLERQLNELQAAEDEPVPTFGLARETVRETVRDALRAAPAPTPSWLDVVDEL